MLSPDIYVSDQEESVAVRTAIFEEIIESGDASDDVIKVLKIQEYYLNTLIGVKDPAQRSAICDAKDVFENQHSALIIEANKLRREAYARLQEKAQSEGHDSINHDAWMRLSPELRSCLAELAMSGRSGMTGAMQQFIAQRHLAELLDTVKDVDELK